MRVKTEVVQLFDKEKDRLITVRKPILRKVSGIPMVQLVDEELDPENIARTPVLRALMKGVHQVDPRVACVKGDRKNCHLYDDLVRVSNRHLESTSSAERKHEIGCPEIRFMQRQPRFCAFCLIFEDKRRRAANRPLARLRSWRKKRTTR